MPLGPGFTVENRACVALYDLPARTPPGASPPPSSTAFAPTRPDGEKSQCTYRCVVLPDVHQGGAARLVSPSQCTYRCVVLPDGPCSEHWFIACRSQCTYRCVVLPDLLRLLFKSLSWDVSMHLQVRGAP